MRRVVVMVSVMVVLALPVYARPHEDRSWRDPLERIAKFLQKLRGGVTSFGDGLVDPRP